MKKSSLAFLGAVAIALLVMPGAGAAITTDISTPFATLAAVAGENAATWDNNENGVPDATEIDCFEALLAGGTAPAVEAAWTSNDTLGSTDLLPAGEAVVPNLSRWLAWHTTRGTTGNPSDIRFLAEFALDGTVDSLTNLKENHGGSTDVDTLAAAIGAAYDISQSAAVVAACGPTGG
ncbi:MAG: hypothetical protein HYV26_16615, partial [Candidatus Hydrogenedentes bacterium]|nr:hypothetical protein [Candidatus Hydrogenedentota bacterium]